jgi:hypothetical protein
MEKIVEQEEDDPFDPARLRIRWPALPSDDDVQAVEVEIPGSPPPRRRYIPSIAESLFDQLNRLPGECLPVYMILTQLCKLQRSKTVALTTARLERSGVGRKQKAEALRRLVDAGFIQVSSTNGKNPLVTLLEV